MLPTPAAPAAAATAAAAAPTSATTGTSTTSTLTARNRGSSSSANRSNINSSSANKSNINSGSPNTLKRKSAAAAKVAMKRSASVSKSLGAPDRARHVALLSSFSESFDPYSIFLTPHYTDEQLIRHRGWMRLLPENWRVPFYVLVWYWPPLFLEFVVSGLLALYETLGPPAHDGWKSLARSELAVPFQLTSFCLSILLVFRTSFERCVVRCVCVCGGG